MSARTRAIYLVNPHNPSGIVSVATTFIAFVREMSKRTTVIVEYTKNAGDLKVSGKVPRSAGISTAKARTQD